MDAPNDTKRYVVYSNFAFPFLAVVKIVAEARRGGQEGTSGETVGDATAEDKFVASTIELSAQVARIGGQETIAADRFRY